MNKLFIMVPSKEDIRMKWSVAVSRPYTKTKHLYIAVCCEDHFDLKFDMLNWMEYKIIGSRVYMRDDAIPPKFINSPIPSEHVPKSQLSSSSRKRRSESVGSLGDMVKRKLGFDRPSIRATNTIHTSQYSSEEEVTTNKIDSPSGNFEVLVNHHSRQSFYVDCESELYPEIIYCEPEPTPMFSDKRIQVNIKPKIRSMRIGASISVRSCITNTVNSDANSFQKHQETPLSISKQRYSSSESSLMNNSSSNFVNSGNYSELSSAFSAISDLRQSTPIILIRKK